MAKLDMDRESVVVEVTLADGEVLRRVKTTGDVLNGTGPQLNLEKLGEGPPEWAVNPKRDWPVAQGPFSFTMGCLPGYEGEARAWLDVVAPEAT